MNTSNNSSYARAKRLITVRQVGDAEAIREVETAIASELVGPELLARDAAQATQSDWTPFASTEAFARAFHAAVSHLVAQRGARPPAFGKYDPLFASPMMFKDLWVTRQVVDELGMPYDAYLRGAITYWVACNQARTPRPTQLRTPDVIAHVMHVWVQGGSHGAYFGTATSMAGTSANV